MKAARIKANAGFKTEASSVESREIIRQSIDITVSFQSTLEINSIERIQIGFAAS